MKRNKPKLSITISPEISKKLEKGKYNKSKLIDSLLDDYFKKLDDDAINNKKI
jgi:hypothetical protein